MLKSSKLTKKRIANGIYEGIYNNSKSEAGTPELEMTCLGQTVGEVFSDQIGDQKNAWLIRCKIPPEMIADGIQTFLICEKGVSTPLDSFSITSGEPLDDDLRNEINLLREELDMLKRAFRRHCVETMG